MGSFHKHYSYCNWPRIIGGLGWEDAAFSLEAQPGSDPYAAVSGAYSSNCYSRKK